MFTSLSLHNVDIVAFILFVEINKNMYSTSCATTATEPTRYVAWWMLAFPVDTVYITNVQIY
jgi:hypothetical protein